MLVILALFQSLVCAERAFSPYWTFSRKDGAKTGVKSNLTWLLFTSFFPLKLFVFFSLLVYYWFMYNFIHSLLLLDKTSFLSSSVAFFYRWTFEFSRSCIYWWENNLFFFQTHKMEKKKNNLALLSMQAFTNHCLFFFSFLFYSKPFLPINSSISLEAQKGSKSIRKNNYTYKDSIGMFFSPTLVWIRVVPLIIESLSEAACSTVSRRTILLLLAALLAFHRAEMDRGDWLEMQLKMTPID